MRSLLLLLMITCGLLVGARSHLPPLEARLYHAAAAQPRAWYEPGSDALGAQEPDEAYYERLRVATRALAGATARERDDGTYAVVPPDWVWGRAALTAAVLAHWYEETRLAYEIHAGLEHPIWDQDKGRARCFGQLHVGLVPAAAWEQLAGLDEDSTRRCALWTARALTRMAHMCVRRGARQARIDDLLLPMFSAMGGGGCAPTVAGRNKTARFAKIWQEMRRNRAPLPTEGVGG